MARTGRPPKPTRLKILQGNPGKRGLPKAEPQPTAGIPSRPEWLSPEAKREWSRLAPHLAGLGLLTPVDRAAFAGYCQSWAIYVEAIKDLEANGMKVVMDSGYEAPRASIGIAVKMLEKLSALGGKFGLSPSDRSRLSVPERPKADPFDEFLKGRSG